MAVHSHHEHVKALRQAGQHLGVVLPVRGLSMYEEQREAVVRPLRVVGQLAGHLDLLLDETGLSHAPHVLLEVVQVHPVSSLSAQQR